jgi:transposase-like protein
MPKNQQKKSKAASAKTKEAAFALYMTGQHDQQEIAAMLGVSQNTITRWKNAHGWEDQLEAINGGKVNTMKFILEQIQALRNSLIGPDGKAMVMTPGQCNQLTQLLTMLAKAETKSTYAMAVIVISELGQWLKENMPKVAVEVTLACDAYLQHKYNQERQ